MPCEMELQGQAAGIAVRCSGRNMTADQEAYLVKVLHDGEGLESITAATEPGPQLVRLGDDIERLKEELAGEVQSAFSSADWTVTGLVFRPGSVEILVLIGATAKVISDFGSIVAGLKALRDTVPPRIREWLSVQAQRVFGQPVEMTALADGVQFHMGPALMNAHLREPSIAPVEAPVEPERAGRRPEEATVVPVAEPREAPRPVGDPPDAGPAAILHPGEPALLRHVVLVNTVLIVVLLAAVIAGVVAALILLI
jgi:hypothetical protein